MGAAPVIGRTFELAQLRGSIDQAIAGRGSITLISGEPGIGKTHLAEAAAAHAQERGATVRWSSCWEEPTAPFWPWAQLLRERPDLLEGAEPYAEGDAGSIRLALFDSIVSYLRTISDARPVLIAIDDLQWADVPSLRLLEFLARDLRDVPIAVIATSRDVEEASDADVRAAIERLFGRTDLIELQGLPVVDVAALMEAVGSHNSEEVARAVHERTAGNPLFVRELARLMLMQPPGRSIGSLPVPEGVRGVIKRRLARLPQECHDLLQVAAVIGPSFSADVLASVVGSDVEGVLGMLDAGERSRLISVSEQNVGTYGFSHALVREVLYASIPASRRRELHHRIGQALERAGGERSGDDPRGRLPELAHHYLLAGGDDVSRGIDLSISAARVALDHLAYEEAINHLRRADDALAGATDDERRSQVLLELGDAYIRAGDLPAARDVFVESADLARSRGLTDALARAALGFGAGLSGFEVVMFDKVQLDLLEEALRARPPIDQALRAWVLARLSVAQAMNEPVEKRRATAEEAVALARRIGDRRALAYALSALCDATAGPDDCESRLELSGEIVRLSREDGDRPMELLGRRLRIVAHLEMGDLAATDAEIGAYAGVADRLKQPLYSWYVPLWRGMESLLAARFDEALERADQAEAIGRKAHSTNAAILTCVLRWMTALMQGLEDEAHALAMRMIELIGTSGEDYSEFFKARHLALTGDVTRATAMIRRLMGSVLTLDVDSEWIPTMCQFSEAIAACDDDESAAEIYETLLPYRRRFGVEGIGAGLHGSVEHHLGLLARTCGLDEQAQEHFEAAIAANGRLGAPVLVARSELALATLLAGAGDRARCRELAGRAERTFRAAGIDRWADLASDLSEPQAAASANVFQREGDLWTLTFATTTVRMKDAKGLRDLAMLLARPRSEIAALDLVVERGSTPVADGGDMGTPGHSGEMLDAEARRRYKERLDELEGEIEEAGSTNDLARGEQARTERDFLVKELSAAYGLGGRARRAGDPAERARTTVTRRIRDTISRIRDIHPALGRHLDNSVRTGTFCSYVPEQEMDWEV